MFNMLNFNKLRSLAVLLILNVIVSACSKDSGDSGTPNPKPPIEEATYQYMLVNISADTLYTFNNDSNKPKENYQEIQLLPGGKVIVKVASQSGITPMIRTKNPLLQTEVTVDPAPNDKIYNLNAYLYETDFQILGDVTEANIFFLNPETGEPDSLKRVALPQSLKYKQFAREITIIAEKQKVNGDITVITNFKGKSFSTKSTTVPFGRITIKSQKQTATAEVFEPEEWPCGIHAGNRLITGKKGGCYYINKNGNKTYVDRSECHCD
jgi:hypothetical protein